MIIVIGAAGRPYLNTPTRFVWFTGPAVFSQARPQNVYLTTPRAALQSAYSEAIMREFGFPIVDGLAISQSRWDACTDGIHYASAVFSINDGWASQVSTMMYQAVMNAVFPDCSGPEL